MAKDLSIKLGTFSALSHKNYRLFFFGQALSLIGTWMQSVALSWLTLELTRSPFLLGILSAVQFAPMTFLSVVGGVAADRFPKRYILLITQSFMMVLSGLLTVLTYLNLVSYWHLLLIAFGLGVANSFDMPTRQAFVIDLVGPEDLTNAIALNSTIFNLARLLGPALAGLVLAKYGSATCFFINTLSFLAVLTGLFLMDNLPARRKPSSFSIKEDLKEGFSYLFKQKPLLRAILTVSALSIFAMNFSVLIPILARIDLKLPAEMFGFMMSSFGFGALMGALSMATFSKRLNLDKVIKISAFLMAIFQLAMPLAKKPFPAMVLLFLTGYFTIAFNSGSNSYLQKNVSDAYRGRVMSIYTTVFAGFAPLGSLFAGSVSHYLNASGTFAAGAIIALILILLINLSPKRKP
ncbi:MFS transporter [Carboxydothermus ferrireducens]|uniref:MFS family arabinose efflux permease n=1 Tax=Carboxydothermus ferrireducens DSM 11255 TaxID=1119529 RepID=A0ABX2R8V4_9THEO|nr:MFS transporter [Carboxydothermus ferrireducens]NYE57354.1 putative MFS family arabinose efflux permease [Carboxydothermus ferrireducens DSM 11255]